jgi:hypothetical protein
LENEGLIEFWVNHISTCRSLAFWQLLTNRIEHRHFDVRIWREKRNKSWNLGREADMFMNAWKIISRMWMRRCFSRRVLISASWRSMVLCITFSITSHPVIIQRSECSIVFSIFWKSYCSPSHRSHSLFWLSFSILQRVTMWLHILWWTTVEGSRCVSNYRLSSLPANLLFFLCFVSPLSPNSK